MVTGQLDVYITFIVAYYTEYPGPTCKICSVCNCPTGHNLRSLELLSHSWECWSTTAKDWSCTVTSFTLFLRTPVWSWMHRTTQAITTTLMLAMWTWVCAWYLYNSLLTVVIFNMYIMHRVLSTPQLVVCAVWFAKIAYLLCKSARVFVVGCEKRGHVAQNTIFASFQPVTIPRPYEPQASHLVCRQFRPSTSQIQR